MLWLYVSWEFYWEVSIFDLCHQMRMFWVSTLTFHQRTRKLKQDHKYKICLVQSVTLINKTCRIASWEGSRETKLASYNKDVHSEDLETGKESPDQTISWVDQLPGLVDICFLPRKSQLDCPITHHRIGLYLIRSKWRPLCNLFTMILMFVFIINYL